ncbi:MAG: hypothetical protein PHO75_00245 [Candidatus Shapirobacteria bacterium]|nr:hypothetical protein [Candidatus Shapirobacteria bacterium]
MTPNNNHLWKYKNLIILFFGIILAIILSQVESFHSFLLHLNNFGYIGAFIAGILFVSTFTVATSALILLTLAEVLSPIEIALIAGLGAVVGDLLIFNLIKDNLFNEIKEIYNKIDQKNHLKKIFYSKYFNWMLPVIGAIIIASPLPDEVGISLMGLSKISTPKFIFISYILNSIGLFLIISASVVIKP